MAAKDRPSAPARLHEAGRFSGRQRARLVFATRTTKLAAHDPISNVALGDLGLVSLSELSVTRRPCQPAVLFLDAQNGMSSSISAGAGCGRGVISILPGVISSRFVLSSNSRLASSMVASTMSHKAFARTISSSDGPSESSVRRER